MKLVIIGCGGHGREMLHLARRAARAGAEISVKGFIDENPELHGRAIMDLPVLGGLEWIRQNHQGRSFIVAIGSPGDREGVVSRLEGVDMHWATLIDPDVHVPEDAEIGEGAMIAAGVIMTTNVKVGRHAIVNTASTLSHDFKLGEFGTLSCGVHVSGNCRIGKGALLGVGASLAPGVKIGEWSVIGAGAAVVKDIPAFVTAVGVPCRVIKNTQQSNQ